MNTSEAHYGPQTIFMFGVSLDAPFQFALKALIFKEKFVIMAGYLKHMKMDAKFIAARKADLENRRQELLKELNVDTVQVSDNDYTAKFVDYGEKEDENAAEVADFEKNLSMEKTLEISLYNVNKAINKIETGDYGICEKCGQLIDPKRLEAFPSATACMECKQKSL